MNIPAPFSTYRYPRPYYVLKEETSGVSSDSDSIERMILEINEHLQETRSNFQFLESLCSLSLLFHRCSESAWDGYEGDPILIDSLVEAASFLQILPSSIPVPEMIPIPTGEIAFEWYKGENRLFAITFTGDRNIIYAGMFGKISNIHGTEYFEDTIPPIILEQLLRLLS